MHDSHMFARTPASATGPLEDLLHRFDDEREITFKEETYLVRDNGAVRRRARVGARRRKLDETWTFGAVNKHSGYSTLNGHVVHRIVATAFCGPQPSPDHVVDHIDTNRLNNRADNLRWVTRLENILLNPITRRRIELAFGSLEAFFENPRAASVPNWDWMRTVTKEQAAESRARLIAWAEKGGASQGGAIGDWLFAPRRMEPVSFESKQRPSALGEASERSGGASTADVGAPSLDTPSLTPGAFQRRWRTPTEFPQCSATLHDAILDEYLQRLPSGAVFARNRYGESIVVEAATANGVLSVVCNTESGVKDWTVAQVFVEGDALCHQAGGTFFTREGALKAHFRTLGIAFDEARYESIDDYA
jgi:hypothetical protein